MLSRVGLFVTLWTVACQPLLSMGIFQAGILKWVAMPSSRGSSQPRDQNQVSCLQADSLPSESPGKPMNVGVGSLSLLSSQPRTLTGVSCIASGFFTSCAPGPYLPYNQVCVCVCVCVYVCVYICMYIYIAFRLVLFIFSLKYLLSPTYKIVIFNSIFLEEGLRITGKVA